MMKEILTTTQRVEKVVHVVRGRRIMLDRDLAKLYGIETRILIQAVKRNVERFPEDFMFQLTWKETQILRSQFVILRSHGKHSKYCPYAFTEHGVVMLANVLKSKRAVGISIEVARAFIRLNQALSGQKELAKEMIELKSFVLKHAQKNDQEFRKVWRAIEKLSTPPSPKEQPRIGFNLNH